MSKKAPPPPVKKRGRIENLTNAGKGRPKGAKNRATVEAKAFWTGIVTDQAYVKKLQERFRNGTVPPAVETMAWYYAAGKPKERVELGADKTLADLVLEAVNGKPDNPKNP